MRAAIISAVVAVLISAASSTAAFVVTSANIKNGTIQPVDLSVKTKRVLKGNRGPRGFAGPPGIQGPPGMPGVSPSYTNAYSAHTTVPPGSITFANAICPAGTSVVGGGYATENVSTATLTPTNSYPVGMPDGRGAWYVVMHNNGAQAEQFWVIAYCISA
jgi:hypothetical protein